MHSHDVKLRKWLQGPSFLLTDYYPAESITSGTDTVEKDKSGNIATVAENHVLTDLIERCGTWSKLKLVIMNCFLFCARCRKNSPSMTKLNSQAEQIILLHCQQTAFPDKYDSILRKQAATNSKILPLNPFLDVDDLLRARGPDCECYYS